MKMILFHFQRMEYFILNPTKIHTMGKDHLIS